MTKRLLVILGHRVPVGPRMTGETAYVVCLAVGVKV